MDPTKYEYQSDFARRYVAQGRAEGLATGEAEGLAKGEAKGLAEGRAEGRAEGEAHGRLEGEANLVLKLLKARFGPVSGEVQARVRAASIDDLEHIAERILTAKSLDESLG